MVFNINTKEVVVFTNKLEKFSRSAIPNAVRSTLNSAAFDVKKNTMPKSADREFIQRAPTFFKANSGVEMASGFHIGSMVATVGFSGKSGNKSDQAVNDLEVQEYGGVIKHRGFIPMNTARVSGSHDKKVQTGSRLGSIKKIINSNTMEGKTPQQKFKIAVKKAGHGGFVLGNNAKETLFKVGANEKLKPLYSHRKGRSVKISQTGFMREATLESAEKMNTFYIQHAEKQLNKFK